MVQHGLNEGVKNMYKTNAILHILKMKGLFGEAIKTIPENKNSKKGLKMNVWRDRLESSLAPNWAAPFFGVPNLGAPMGLQKTSEPS